MSTVRLRFFVGITDALVLGLVQLPFLSKRFRVNELNKRNTATVEETLKLLGSKLYETCSQIALQQQAISAMSERMTSLEQTLMIQKVQLTGLGPSVKG